MIQHRHLVTLGAAACVALSLGTAWGAELRGRMTLASGQPAANEAIQLKDKEIGRTDGTGAYLLNLPAGKHTLTVKGQPVDVQVSPNGSRQDVRLK
ncbi:MAG: hypothetical protein DME05_12665 [Candidatus Rokuibacteriota bacterium]|nr:MAG: hypothetical protein DME05_12665 [Candidatus Rokubacteria bacterium]